MMAAVHFEIANPGKINKQIELTVYGYIHGSRKLFPTQDSL